MFNMITGNEVNTSEEQIREVFNRLDLNGDGLVDFREYSTSM
jgi:Ca2+-binding EF-hand superfamily protein